MTAEAAARGRRNRSHGHATELMVVKYLREQGWPDTCTTRAKLGHAGTHTPGDISWHPLVVLETWPDLRVCGSVRAQNNSGPGAIGVAPDRGQHPGRGAVMQDVTCACGCGGNPVSGRYLKGHNAKLRGRREVDHGTRAKYRHGCRCDSCRGANRVAKQEQARARGVLPRSEAHAHRRKPRLPRPPAPTPAERFHGGYLVDSEGCWIWQRALNHGGYGVAWDGTRTVVAHRYAYELLAGPIPAGLHLDHLCRVRACVNPAHLEPVTQAENNRRAAVYR